MDLAKVKTEPAGTQPPRRRPPPVHYLNLPEDLYYLTTRGIGTKHKGLNYTKDGDGTLQKMYFHCDRKKDLGCPGRLHREEDGTKYVKRPHSQACPGGGAGAPPGTTRPITDFLTRVDETPGTSRGTAGQANTRPGGKNKAIQGGKGKAKLTPGSSGATQDARATVPPTATVTAPITEENQQQELVWARAAAQRLRDIPNPRKRKAVQLEMDKVLIQAVEKELEQDD